MTGTTPAVRSSLGGRTVLVTGATRGIGRVVAVELAAAGARVAIHGRDPVAAAEVAGMLADGDRHAGTFLHDLANEDPAEVAGRIAAALPALDGAVLVAGADVLTGTAAAWSFERKLDVLLRVDVKATMVMARTLGRAMAGRDRAALVTIGWDQAECGMEGDSGELFAASKGAVMAFTRSLARSLGPQVRANCVAPGWIRTAWGEQASNLWQDRAVRESVLGRWGVPLDVAGAVRWLLSEESSFVTGQVIAVNGGFRGG